MQTHSCYCCSGVILDHATLLGMIRPTLPLVGCILSVEFCTCAAHTKDWTEVRCLTL